LIHSSLLVLHVAYSASSLFATGEAGQNSENPGNHQQKTWNLGRSTADLLGKTLGRPVAETNPVPAV